MATTGRVNHELDRPAEERIKDALPSSCMFGENVSKHTNIDYSIGDMMASVGHRKTYSTKDSRPSASASFGATTTFSTSRWCLRGYVRRGSGAFESLDDLAEEEDRASDDDFSRRARDLARPDKR